MASIKILIWRAQVGKSPPPPQEALTEYEVADQHATRVPGMKTDHDQMPAWLLLLRGSKSPLGLCGERDHARRELASSGAVEASERGQRAGAERARARECVRAICARDAARVLRVCCACAARVAPVFCVRVRRAGGVGRVGLQAPAAALEGYLGKRRQWRLPRVLGAGGRVGHEDLVVRHLHDHGGEVAQLKRWGELRQRRKRREDPPHGVRRGVGRGRHSLLGRRWRQVWLRL